MTSTIIELDTLIQKKSSGYSNVEGGCQSYFNLPKLEVKGHKKSELGVDLENPHNPTSQLQ